MQTFFMLGKYSATALKGISSTRTKRSSKLIEEFGGKLISMHAALGAYDLVLQISLPDMEAAIKLSVALAKATGIAFTSLPAIPVDRFDKMVARL